MLTTNIVNFDEVAPHIRGVMDSIPRSQFIPEVYNTEEYEDMPVPIGEGVNCSKPSTIGYMMSLLTGKGTVLEIGTGCGWQTALLTQLYDDVCSIEVNTFLYEKAKCNLKDYNVKLRYGNGMKGWNTDSKFDNIIVCAAINHFPTNLIEQLNVGGVLVVPVINGEQQILHQIVKTKDYFNCKIINECRFVEAI